MSDQQATLDASLVELTEQPTVAVRVQQPFSADLARIFDVQIPRVIQTILGNGGSPTGAPFARYHQFGPERVDVEIGFPDANAVAALPALDGLPPGEIGNSKLPGGRVAMAVHRGSYDGLSATYDHLHDWIHAQGVDEGDAPWESDVDDPGAIEDPSQIRTEVYWPLG